MIMLFHIKRQSMSHLLIDIFIKLINCIRIKAKKLLYNNFLKKIKKVQNKLYILEKFIIASVANLKDIIEVKIYLNISKEKLLEVIVYLKRCVKWYQKKIQEKDSQQLFAWR